MRRPLAVLAAAALALGLHTPVASADDPEAPTPSSLLVGDALVAWTSGDTLQNGDFTLAVTPGSVRIDEVIPVPGSTGISSATHGSVWGHGEATDNLPAHDHTQLRLRRDGDLVLTSARGHHLLWHSRTAGSGAVRLTMHKSGNLALHTSTGKVVWSSRSGRTLLGGGMGLGPGQWLHTPGESGKPGYQQTSLRMQRNGDLVHRCGKRVDWRSHTHVRGSSLRMYSTGALRIVSPEGRIVWSSHSGGHDFAWFDGINMMIFSDGIRVAWGARLHEEACYR